MARPIEPTPPLGIEDSKRLLRDLEAVCSPAEAERRAALAETAFDRIMSRGRQGKAGGDASGNDRSR